MYEPVAHETLNGILDRLHAVDPTPMRRSFLTRLGANFYAIFGLFRTLYGGREDVEHHLERLVQILVRSYAARAPELIERDRAREAEHDWFLQPRWVAMALYTDGFAGDLLGVTERLGYLQELGVDVVHLMPVLRCPVGASDGGYAVSDFRDVDPRAGTLQQVRDLAAQMRARDMLLVLDVVLNHTSDQHAWATRAAEGDPKYQGYYHTFPDRTLPDLFERSMPEVFPHAAPGNFTWSEAMERWVMTVFHDYQWDLDYGNPAVFLEMLDIVLFWANQGADILRLDAVAFIWKRLGTTCQNQREAHLLLQLFKDCCQVVAPGVLFIAEAIVAPVEVIKYFGEDAVAAKECEIAYNATLMALLWDAVATRNVKLLSEGIRSLPDKLDLATWLNYARCHDDIGLGFSDADVEAAGYDPRAHRHFLLDYFTGDHPLSNARGARFGENTRTGDARIAGSLASLVGLETALEAQDPGAVDAAIRRILLLHAVILSFGGIPLLYYGDELGTLNDGTFRSDPSKSHDTRWMHRPRLSDALRDRRHQRGTVEQRVYSGIQHLIAVRKTVAAFADRNNRQLLASGDEHVLAYLRADPTGMRDDVLVLANFAEQDRAIDLAWEGLGPQVVGFEQDRVSGRVRGADGRVLVPGSTALWLTRR